MPRPGGRQVRQHGHSTVPHLHYEERVQPLNYADHRKPELDLFPWKIPDMGQIVKSFRREPGTSLTLYLDNTRVAKKALRYEGAVVVVRAARACVGGAARGMQAWEAEQGWTPTGVPSYEGMSRLGRRWGQTVTS